MAARIPRTAASSGSVGGSTPSSALPDAAALVAAGTVYDPTASGVAKRIRGVDNFIADDGGAGVPWGVTLTGETSIEVDVRGIFGVSGGATQIAPIMVVGSTSTLFAGWCPQFGTSRASYANAGGFYQSDLVIGTGLGTAGQEFPRLWRSRIAGGVWLLEVGRADGVGGFQYDPVMSASYASLNLGTFVAFGVGGIRAKGSLLVAGARAPAVL